jgi:hypothetical protein
MDMRTFWTVRLTVNFYFLIIKIRQIFYILLYC